MTTHFHLVPRLRLRESMPHFLILHRRVVVKSTMATLPLKLFPLEIPTDLWLRKARTNNIMFSKLATLALH